MNEKISILCYGASDSGKSTQVRYLAEYVHRTLKKRTRLIAADRGSLWEPVQDLVDEGIVEPLEFPTSYEFNPFAIMRKLRRGEFPQGGVINKPEAVQTRNAKGELEIKYKANTIWNPWTEKETAEIGAIAFDSLSSYATAFMSDAKQKNLRTGSEAGNAPRTEEGEQMGTNTQSHYNDAHTEILDSLQAFQSLPVPYTLFTALEGLGTDDDSGSKRPALGPDTVGKAIVSKLPQRVTVCLHLVAEGVGTKKEVKAFYSKHDSGVPGLQWPAKSGVRVDQLDAFYKRWPSGYIPLSRAKGIGELLEFRASLMNGKEK